MCGTLLQTFAAKELALQCTIFLQGIVVQINMTVMP
jgi:hypothetical protein